MSKAQQYAENTKGKRSEAPSPAPVKKFDLNIERVLEDWSVQHALREIIANAMDEQALTNTNEVDIFKDNVGQWHIRDYGRGLREAHLTQKENKEKLAQPNIVIGKFGVGLKDAFATFDRKGVTVQIRSKYADITTRKEPKHGFEHILTLHALINEPFDPHFLGTEFILAGVKDEEMALAKDLFLKFARHTLLDNTSYGQVIEKSKGPARIYITGLRVAEEKNFLFSYNITNVTGGLRRALNRERNNVGRAAYQPRIKDVLLQCQDKRVAELLVDDLKKFATSKLHDELAWIDVKVHACKLLNAAEQVIFLTPRELIRANDMIDRAQKDGKQVITIPEDVKVKLQGVKDYNGNPIRDLTVYTAEWNKSFAYTFILEKDLTKQERAVFAKTKDVFNLIGGKPRNVKEIRISSTMRIETQAQELAVGIWEPDTGQIIIKRTELKNVQSYAGTLLHETAHARSNARDITAEFEQELTKLLGVLAGKSVG